MLFYSGLKCSVLYHDNAMQINMKLSHGRGSFSELWLEMLLNLCKFVLSVREMQGGKKRKKNREMKTLNMKKLNHVLLEMFWSFSALLRRYYESNP